MISQVIFSGLKQKCKAKGKVAGGGLSIMKRAGRRIKIKNDELYISFSETFGCATPN